jgi:lipopolysaccharide/colanic/teichoic acid biosynthesis glycosyltransferase
MLTNLDSVHAPETRPAGPPPGRPRKHRRDKAEPAPLTPPAPTRAQRWYAPLRRALDFTGALVLLALTGPFLLLAALAVKLTSRGPAFYTQVRTGRGGRPFTIYKVRTMVDNCESLTGPRWTIPGDPRVTPVGWLLRRTHFDELPQLVNVVKGEMSLIGPRPERPEFVRKLDKAVPGYLARHHVLPGITGLAQVQLPPDTDVESVRRKLQYDLYYVRQWGLLLDLRIAVSTPLHMLGVSFAMLRRLRLVPTPAPAAEAAAEVAAPEPPTAAPLLHRHAA